MAKTTILWLPLTLAVTLTGCVSNTSAPVIEDASFNQSAPKGLYTVKRGDTIYSIAWQQNIDFRQLAELNNLAPPYNIQPGQSLRLDNGTTAPTGPVDQSSGVRTIALGDTTQQGSSDDTDDSWLLSDQSAGSSPQATPSTSPNVSNTAAKSAMTVSGGAAGAVASAPSSSSPSQKSDQAGSSSASQPSSQQETGTSVAGEQPVAPSTKRTYTPVSNVNWQWPVMGDIVGTFADKTNLTAGIDIAGQKGQSVKAAGPGIVVYAGSGVRGYGNLIILKHNDHFLSAYAHNDTLRVKENDVVETGQVIATMGSSEADQVKLHFEIRQDGQPKDPLKFLPDR
ncbi:peptidoglycan DD-metalloendopeptidase family protein [Phytohalomonas tamaricis]|uniref:peptidoglycan DD-metalloendopeptidase family protein n=1 Tax=Phytohalomonas tamaricis TaxID=2081032 RepID=UPI000D0BBB82|nr:peptidoglycan DD-metalloendopeptidase family protein [Phytohalomonas tamaricis]